MRLVLAELATPWGPLAVYSYGLFVGLALLASWYLGLFYSLRTGLSRPAFAACWVLTVVVGFFGGTLSYRLVNLGDESAPGLQTFLRGSGSIAYGTFLFGAAASYLHHRIIRRNYRELLDAAAPCVGAGVCLGRIGCYLAGCDFGHLLPHGAPGWLARLGTFPRWEDGSGSPAWLHHVATLGLDRTRPHSLPVHPVQLYAALAGLVLLLLALLLWRRRRFPGEVFLVVAAGYATWRFGSEFLRADPDRGLFGPFSATQWFSLALLPLLALSYLRSCRQWLAIG